MCIDADCAVKRHGQNSVISFVILKWLLPESLIFWLLVKENEDSGNEIEKSVTVKVWVYSYFYLTWLLGVVQANFNAKYQILFYFSVFFIDSWLGKNKTD